MVINSAMIRTWSILGQRGTYGSALTELMAQNEQIVALSADLCNTSGLDRLNAKFPDRFINTGIAEQNLVGVAAGIADSKKIPFASTFANFVSLRACEFIRHFMGYMKCNIKMVGLGSGFAMGLFGNTHYGLEDIATLREIPNLIILSPADGLEVVKCIQAAAEVQAPVYIRLCGVMNQSIVYRDDIDFTIGKAIKLAHGKDVAIIATGSMVYRAMKAADILRDKGISCSVLDMHTIKPIDIDAISECCKYELIVSVEEHGIIGGLGSTVAEILASKKNRPRLKIIGVEQKYFNAGDYEYMLEQVGLTASSLAKDIEISFRE